jgi:hypothetical protein
MERSLFDELKEFPGRETGLRKITRYHIYHPMFYRTNDWSHARHVHWIVRFLGRFATFDQIRAEAMALVHDDAELLIGDEQAGNKAKMEPEQLAAIESKEREAIDALAKRFPATLGGYPYRGLLLEAIGRKSPEAQLVQFADKFDAFGEALHEITAGNLRFATNVITEYGTITIPPAFYAGYFERFAAKYPDLAFLTEGSGKTLDLETCASADWKTLATQGTLHNRKSLAQPTILQPYNLWKEILLTHADEEEIKNLITRSE